MSEKQSDGYFRALSGSMRSGRVFPAREQNWPRSPSLLLALVNSSYPDTLSDRLVDFRLSGFLFDEHGITIREEAVLIGDRVLIRLHGVLVAGKRTDQHDQS